MARLEQKMPTGSIPPSRRMLFGLFTFGLFLGVAEGAAQVIVWYLDGATWREFQEQLSTTGTTLTDSGEIVHPYVGAVFDPTAPPDYRIGGKPVVINRLGFSHATEPIQKRAPDRFIVGITGGSVAWQMVGFTEQLLTKRLQEIPQLQNREVRIVCLALGGHKQPQQLMAVNYLLSLGGEFDLVVNLDGFNEVALADLDYRRGVSPSYPRAWSNKLPIGFDLSSVSDRFRMWEVRGLRQRHARSILNSWLRWSALRQLWWRAADRQLRSEESLLAPRVVDGALRDRVSYFRNGPEESFSSDAEMYTRFVEIWANSSHAMHALAKGSGFTYIHCLQPNQYDPKSKPLSEEEADYFYSPKSEFRPSVEAGYPMLRASGEQLLATGVRFHDLSGIFAQHSETLYVDDCCHFNPRGNELLAERVAEIIRMELDRP